MWRLKWNITVVVLTCALLTMITEVNSVRYIVGANKGWTSNVNYTVWAQGKHFYTEDWLFFVYDRNQMDVLEVNKANYETCNAEHPLHNYTTGAGRDVVPLNMSRHYYFISGKGNCFSGMKLAINVEKQPPPPPQPSPIAALPPQRADSPFSSPEESPTAPFSPPPLISPTNSASPPNAMSSPPPSVGSSPPPSRTSGTSDTITSTSTGGGGMCPGSATTISIVVGFLALSLVVLAR